MPMLSRTSQNLLLCCSVLAFLGGCFAPWFKNNSTLTPMGERREAIKEKLQSDKRPRIIAEIGAPAMLTISRLQNIGLVTQLHQTGGTVKASPQREKILDVMRRNDTDQPNVVLDDDSTTMVVASVDVSPAARAGDLLDVLVQLSSHSNATDLEHGFLMGTPLMEMSRLGGQVREGFERAVARGPVVTRTQMFGEEKADSALNGVVIGGAKLLKERQLGIGIESEFADAITMAAIVPAINHRFTYFNGRKQTGIATPREDSYIELAVPPRYRFDPFHFVNVVLQVSFNETETQRANRIEELTRQLREPTTARTASWQMEAIGADAIPLLVDVLSEPDPEIRFYAAHALAYLNDKRGISELSALCLAEPAFRAMCLNGLVVLDHFEATDALRELLNAANAEVRFGAMLSLRQKDGNDPQVSGDQIADAGSILEIPTSGPPLVVVSLTKLPEVVIFGETPVLYLPDFHYVNKRILVSSNDRGGFTVSYFQAGEEDRIVHSQPDLRSVLTAIAEVGGTYGDWVKFLRESHEQGYFAEPFEMNPVPTAGRVYNRSTSKGGEPGEELVEETMISPSLDTATEGTESDSPGSIWYNPLTWGK